MLNVNQLKNSLYIGILLGVMSLSNFVYASMEVTAYGGGNFNNEMKLSNVINGQLDQEYKAWIVGFDLVYRSILSDSSCGIGLRYQHNLKSMPYKAGGGDTGQNLMFNSNRIAILGNYRFINVDEDTDAGLFVGVLAAWDVFRSMSVQVDAGTGGGISDTLDITSNKWLGLTGQVGLETGFRWTNFFVRGEVGYSYYGFNDFKCTGQACASSEEINDRDFGLSGVYGTVGIGWFFI